MCVSVCGVRQKHLSKASLQDLKHRTDAARDHLNRHRALIDRYLPTYLYLGPSHDVKDVVEHKVSELFDRSDSHVTTVT